MQTLAAQPSVAADANAKKCTLRGRVINSVTGDPIQYVLVQITNVPPPRAVFTDAGGEFEFKDLSPSNVMLAAHKPGFHIAGKHSMASPFTVELKAETTTFEIRLVPEAVITAHVADDNGEPIEGAVVKVIRSAVRDGRKTWETLPIKTTDEEGNFRLADLLPGKYYAAVQAQRPVAPGSPDSRQGYAGIVYYGGGTDRSTASPIEIKAGGSAHLEFVLKQVPTFSVSGEVTGFPADSSVGIAIFNHQGEEMAFARAFDPARGSFRFPFVPAGSYIVRATSWAAEGDNARGEAAVNVNHDVAGVRLAAQPVISIPVVVRVEASQSASANTKYTRWIDDQPVHKALLSASGMGGTDAQLTRDGKTFLFKNVAPGTYSLIMETSYDHVRSATCGSTDLMREDLVVAPGTTVPPIEVVVTNDTGALFIKGLAAEPGGRTGIIMVPDTAPRWPQLTYLVGPETMLAGLAPGNYKIFAFDWVDEIAYRDPEVLKQYASKASEVTVPPDGQATVTVNVIPVEEQ